MPIPRDARPLRTLRWAEVAYAIAAMLVVAGLPAPSPRNSLEWVHWLGTAILAGMIALKLRRPNHAIWWVAALLAAWVLGVATFAVLGGLTGRAGLLVPTAPLAIAMIVVLLGTQVVAAVCLSAVRHLRRS